MVVEAGGAGGARRQDGLRGALATLPGQAPNPFGDGSALSLSSDPFFLAMAESSGDCIRLLNLAGEVQFMNRRGQALFEIDDWSRNRGRYWPSLLPPSSIEAADAAVQSALRGEVARFRCYCPTSKGKPKWWDTVVSPVQSGETGVLIGLIATSHDITGELETEAFLKAVVDSAPLMVMVKDAVEGRFELINRRAEQVFGMSREVMLGRTDHDFFPREQADFFREQDRRAVEQGSTVTIDEEAVQTEHGLRYFRTRKVGIYGPEGPQHVVCVAEDITEERNVREELRIALNAAEAANRAKSDFLANMSHEIRTPLNGVIGVAELLSGTALDARQREMAELIRVSGRSLERLLSDILDFARIEAGGLELRPEPFQLDTVVGAVADLLDVQVRAKGLRLELDLAPEARGRFIGDEARLRQVLINLLNNAVKFTPAGRVALRVEPEDGGFRFSVEDSGVGFDPALKAALFGRFQQADGSITRRFGGSGLGLAIARQLVELMGGAIDCESEPGAGARFHFVVPLPPAAPGSPVEAGCGVGVPDERGLRVLLADDHPMNRQFVELVLEPLAAEVTAVEDGCAAVEAFAPGAFDLVLMDMQMPQMDGLTASRLIREIEIQAGAPRTPLAMLTANALPEHVQASLAAGADRHIAKPVTPSGLIREIVELLEAQSVSGGAHRSMTQLFAGP